jgi:hypothetical protein
MSAMAEGEDYAPPGRASGGEKLAEWEIKAPLERGLSTENEGTNAIMRAYGAALTESESLDLAR